MELKNKVENIVLNIVNDARSKWSSHEEESDGINDYTNELVKLILLDSSLQLKEKEEKDFFNWSLVNCKNTEIYDLYKYKGKHYSLVELYKIYDDLNSL